VKSINPLTMQGGGAHATKKWLLFEIEDLRAEADRCNG
jgi:hypothetical protein